MPRSGRRLPRWIAGVALVCGLGIGLAACGNDGTSLARQACGHVERSIALYQQSTETTDPVRSEALAQQAYIELRRALPITSQAAQADGL